MKAIPIIYILLSLTIIGLACQKEVIAPDANPVEAVQDNTQAQLQNGLVRQFTVSEAVANNERVTITSLPEMPNEQERGSLHPSGCSNDAPPYSYLYAGCEQAIDQSVSYFQAMADQTCQNLKRCVTCYADDELMHVIIDVRHNCSIIPPPTEF